jgi:rhamnulose-1-phosphate aldolase/alcohol dehydrogenase
MGSYAEIAELLDQCHSLGTDAGVAGGSVSVKAKAPDPVTGEDVELLWVNGFGTDLGSLTVPGLAVLRLDRVRALADGPGDDDPAVFEYCTHGRSTVVPPIDAALHALLPAAHVTYLQPDAVLALATAAGGRSLVHTCFGDRVPWVPWRRPGVRLALELADTQRQNPHAIGAVLGGQGLVVWGESSAECQERAAEIARGAEAFVRQRGKEDPLGGIRPSWARLPDAMREERAAELAPFLRGLLSQSSRESTGRSLVGHYIGSEHLLNFLCRERLPELAARGVPSPEHLLRSGIRPLVLDTSVDAPTPRLVERLHELHTAYRREYRAYYERYAKHGTAAMRGADPSIVLVPGVGLFSFGEDKRSARLAGETYVHGLDAIRGAEALSEYRPIPEEDRFRVEYGMVAARPAARPLSGRVALVTGGGSGIGRAIVCRLAAEGACVVVADADRERAEQAAREAGASAARAEDAAIPVVMDVSYASSVNRAFAEACRAFGGVDLVVNNAGLSVSKPLAETTDGDWDLQHRVLARGPFLVARAAARILTEQGVGGDLVYVGGSEEGPDTIAHGTAKVAQEHQVRLLAAELGPSGIRVNGVDPDLGRSIEFLPDHVAAAVFVLSAGELAKTTGTYLPVGR